MSDSNSDYGSDFQQLMLQFMLGSSELFGQSQDIIKSDYFDDKLRPAARFILEYVAEYRHLPSQEQVKAISKIDVVPYIQANDHKDFYLKNIEAFCRYRALENAVLCGVDLLEKGQGADLEKMVKDAMQISLVKDLGTSYFADPKTRLLRVNDRSNIMATGWKTFDKRLEGGFTRGSLNIFAGGSGCVVEGTKVRVVRLEKIDVPNRISRKIKS